MAASSEKEFDNNIELESTKHVDGVHHNEEAPSSMPGNVNTLKQLDSIPEKFKTQHFTKDEKIVKARPLLNIDAGGNKYTYALNPFTYSVFLILVLELLERFSFYAIFMTQTNYLTGSYSSDGWYADMTSMEAASLISLSTAVAYTVPFIGGVLADRYFGDYKTILLGVTCFYIPGLFVIASSTTSKAWWLGTQEFNVFAYKVALLFLWPVGSGIVKSVVNVFGARQFHPVLQRSMIEAFYVQFYMVINIGAVAGCIIVPVVARQNITVAYTIPFALLCIAVVCFVGGYKRYVVVAPHTNVKVVENASSSSVENASGNLVVADDFINNPTFKDVAKMLALIIPFNVVYSQCATTFMLQGAVMEPFLGIIEAPSLNILDSLSVLVSGYFVSTFFYPHLAKRNIKLETGYKFALGSFLGACAILWSLLLEQIIHKQYTLTGEAVNVIWQAPSYILIGAGEIFSISTAYEVAFTASPPNRKAFACAFNLFCIGGVPNMVSLGLYRLCAQWFQDKSGRGNIGHVQSYSEAHVYKYFWVLLGIVMCGVVVNLLPPVREWIASVEDRAAKASSACGTVSTAKVTDLIQQGETEPLMKTQQYIKYLEEGSSAQIYRANTMKAEYTRSNKLNNKGRTRKEVI